MKAAAPISRMRIKSTTKSRRDGGLATGGVGSGRGAGLNLSGRASTVPGEGGGAGMEAGAREFMESIALGPGEWDRLPAQVQRTFVFNAPTFLDELLDPDGAIIDVRALSTFPHPALLTRGTLSPPFFPAVVAVLAGALSHAEEYAFAGAGHVPQRSHPDSYVEKITEFASRVTSHRT